MNVGSEHLRWNLGFPTQRSGRGEIPAPVRWNLGFPTQRGGRGAITAPVRWNLGFPTQRDGRGVITAPVQWNLGFQRREASLSRVAGSLPLPQCKHRRSDGSDPF